MPIDPNTITADIDAGTASMNVSNLEVPDFFTVPNSLMGGGPDPVTAVVSFDIQWDQEIERYSLNNEELAYAGDFVDCVSTLSWTSENPDGFTYSADPFDSGYAMIGTMRNGSFL